MMNLNGTLGTLVNGWSAAFMALVLVAVGFFLLNRVLQFARRFPRFAVGADMVSGFFGWVPALLDRAYSRAKNPLLRGDRLAYAKQMLPPDHYPAAWRTDIPEDLRKPLWHDGRLVTGQFVAELAKREMSDRVLVKLIGTAVYHALWTTFGLAVLIGLVYSSSLAISGNYMERVGASYPTWAEDVGAIMPIVAWYALLVLDFLWRVVVGFLVLAAPLALLVVAMAYFNFNALVAEWWSYTARPLLFPTRDTLLHWKSNTAKRQNLLKVYNRQIEEATGRLAGQPFIPVGRTTGTLRSRGMDMAPLPGVMLGFDGESVRTHTLVLGDTGTGKTRLVIKPLFRRIMEADWGAGHRIGAYITDGKGTLWKDLVSVVADRSDAVVIGTGEGHFGVDLVQGMEPSEIANAFVAVNKQVSGGGGEGKDAFWVNQAALLVMHVARIARGIELDPEGKEAWIDAHNCRPYSLIGFMLLATDAEVAKKAFGMVQDAARKFADDLTESEKQPFVHAFESIDYMSGRFFSMAQETRSSVVANITVVFGQLESVPEINDRFCRGTFERTVDVDHALKGGVVMVALSGNSQGLAGTVVSVWLKTRLYILARRRLDSDPAGCKATSCCMVADEFQMLATTGPDSDTDVWATARETGLFLIAATQSLAALEQTMGKTATKALITLLRSKIVLEVGDVDTRKTIQSLTGTVEVGKQVPEHFFATQDEREGYWGGPRQVVPHFDKVRFGHLWPKRIECRVRPYDICNDPLPGIDFRHVDASLDRITMALKDKKRQEESYLTNGLKEEPVISLDQLKMGGGMAFAIIQRAGGSRMDMIDLSAA